jgi:hypothetical protein
MCDCGRPHADCPVWSKLLVPGKSYLEPSLDELGLVQNDAAPETHAWWHALKVLRREGRRARSPVETRYLALYCDLYRAFAHTTAASIVLDNSKSPVDAALLAGASDVHAYCVQIVRDPRGVLFSRRKRSSPDRPGRVRPSETIRTAIYWMLRQLTFDAIRRRYGEERSLLVLYEQLMKDPQPVLSAACRMLGEGEPEGELRTRVPLAMPEVHGPDGNGRFTPTEVVLREDNRWRSELHPFDRVLMTLLTFPFLRRYGYSIRTQRTAEGDALTPTLISSMRPLLVLDLRVWSEASAAASGGSFGADAPTIPRRTQRS